MLIDKIKTFLNIPSEDNGNGLRASSSGSCTRQIAYKYHGFEGIPLNWRAKLVFDLGDKIETQMAGLSEQFGLKDRQKTISVEIGGVKIFGHVDGIFEDMVVDFKSTTTYALKDARKGNVGSYKYTMHFYMKGAGLKKALLVYYCKETSALEEVVIEWDENVWLEIVSKFTKVITSTKDSLPDRDYGPNANGFLPWQCSYCSYVKQCYPQANLTFTDDGKPQLKIKKEK